MMAGPRLWLKGKRKAIKMIKRRHPFCLNSNIFFALIMPIVLMSTLLCPFKDLIFNFCMLPTKLKLIYCCSSLSIPFHTKFLVQPCVFGEWRIYIYIYRSAMEDLSRDKKRINKKKKKTNRKRERDI